MELSEAEFADAVNVVASTAVRTPLLPLTQIGADLGCEVLGKAETLQRTGSFKYRGATYAVAQLTTEQLQNGVITYSAGNHGQALAAAAAARGSRAVVVMPEDAVAAKVAGVRRYGGEVVVAGTSIAERKSAAEEFASTFGHTVVPPFDDRNIILGQSTIGTEILEQDPRLGSIVVPIGGGGLISGIALAVKARKPRVKVIGVEPSCRPVAQLSRRANCLTHIAGVDTIADGLNSTYIGELNWSVIRQHVDDVVLVSEESILHAIGVLARDAKQVVEPAGAVGLAAFLDGSLPRMKDPAAVVLSGGNINPDLLHRSLTLSHSLEG